MSLFLLSSQHNLENRKDNCLDRYQYHHCHCPRPRNIDTDDWQIMPQPQCLLALTPRLERILSLLLLVHVSVYHIQLSMSEQNQRTIFSNNSRESAKPAGGKSKSKVKIFLCICICIWTWTYKFKFRVIACAVKFRKAGWLQKRRKGQKPLLWRFNQNWTAAPLSSHR